MHLRIEWHYLQFMMLFLFIKSNYVYFHSKMAQTEIKSALDNINTDISMFPLTSKCIVWIHFLISFKLHLLLSQATGISK